MASETIPFSVINVSKSICKIFGKQYRAPTERMPAEANWFVTVEQQAKVLLSAMNEQTAVKQVECYIKYCRQRDRRLIGTNYKVAETVMGSNWIELLGESPPTKEKRFENAEYYKNQWTREAWEERYKGQLETDPEFRKHFGYDGKLPVMPTVGIKN